MIWSEVRISEFPTTWLSLFKRINYRRLYKNIKEIKQWLLTSHSLFLIFTTQCIPSPLPITRTCTPLSEVFLWLLKPPFQPFGSLEVPEWWELVHKYCSSYYGLCVCVLPNAYVKVLISNVTMFGVMSYEEINGFIKVGLVPAYKKEEALEIHLSLYSEKRPYETTEDICKPGRTLTRHWTLSEPWTFVDSINMRNKFLFFKLSSLGILLCQDKPFSWVG